jgi:hypothetical protein
MFHDLNTVFQKIIHEAIPSHKCHKNMALILGGNESADIWTSRMLDT